MAVSEQGGRIPGLDGLRAVAALAVFGVHYDQIVRFTARVGPFDVPRVLANGNHGVSLFFTLSGFLLSIPFWRACRGDAARPRISRYAARRAARILPAYLGALAALVLLDGLWRVPEARIDILLHATFLFNYTEFSFFSINSPFWTLAVEMQFYLLLPVLFLFLRSGRIGPSFLFLGVVALGSFGLHFFLNETVSRIVPWPGDPRLTWIRPGGAVLSHSLPGHLPHFLIGVAASLLFLEGSRRKWFAGKRAPALADVAILVSALAALVLLGTRAGDGVALLHGRYHLPVVPLLLAGIVFAAPLSRVARAALDGFPLRRLGAISYGFYVYHVPVLNRVDRYLSSRGMDAAEHPVLLVLAGLAGTVLVATVSFLVIERPVLRFVGRRLRKA